MDSSGELECTQVLQDSDHGEPQDRFETEKLHVGCLAINATQFPVFNGDTFIGRDPKRCSIILDRKSISSHHALIEVESGHHLICDLGSSNSTRLNGMLLKPHVRYNLTNDANVQFADLKGIYYIIEPSRAISCDTSSDDIFATPAKSRIGSTPRNSSLNFSGDESVIGSTPMRSNFKQPLPRTASKPSQRDSDSFYQQATSYQSATNTPVSNSSKIDIYEAETQTEEESDTSLFNDTVDNSNCQRVISSFVVPCTQEVSGNSSIQLHYEADQSMNDCSVELHEDGNSLIKEKAASSNILDDSRSKKGDELDREELSDVEQKFIEEEMDRIERSMSSEMLENTTTVSALQDEEKSTGEVLQDNKNPPEVRRETTSIHSPNQATKLTNYNITGNVNICEAAPQIVNTVASKSETDDEGVYGACTEAPRKMDDVHDAATQMLEAPKDNDDRGKQATPSIENKNANKSINIHEAATQMVDTVASDSETDDEGVYGACTEAPRKMDDIHDAKTQMLEKPTDNDDCEEQATSLVHNKSAGKSVNIHEAATQMVDTGVSDSETDDEGVYGACTEAPRKIDDIHDAKTQMLQAPTDNDEYEDQATPSIASQTTGNSVNIHEAVTQMVDTVVSDSETDDEGVYGASTEAPRKMADIHDAKTQMLEAATDNDNIEEQATNSVGNKTAGRSANIHEAATQMVDTVASDSETDDEGVYGACTEAPRKNNDIHDAKTQMLQAPTDNNEYEDQATPSISSQTIGKSVNIHDAVTQMVDTVASDSETDDEGVYGACTEAPRKMDDIYDGKTQMLEAPTDNDDCEEQATSVENKNAGESVNIHEAATQMVDTVASDSETDDEGVYGACAEVPRKMDDIHDTKTQMLEAPTDIDDVGEPASSSVESKTAGKSVNIHEAATQMVHTVVSDSETDDRGVYVAGSKVPQTKDDIHDAKTPTLEEGTQKNSTEDFASSSINAKNFQAKKCSPKKRLSLCRMKKKDTSSAAASHSTVTQGNTVNVIDPEEDLFSAATQLIPQPVVNHGSSGGTDEKDDFCSAATQILCSPGRRKSVRGGHSKTGEDAFTAGTKTLPHPQQEMSAPSVESVVKEDIFTAATQILPSPSRTKPLANGQSREEEDIFSAATQILPSPGPTKSVSCDQEKICIAATEVLCSPSSSKSIPAEKLNVKNRTSSSPSAKKIEIVAMPVVSKSPGKIPPTLALNLNTKAEQREVSDQIDEHPPKVSNIRQVNRTRTTRQRSQPKNSKNFKMLGSSSPEADIENTSSDSVKSIDHMIDDDDDTDNIHDLAVNTSKTLQKPTSGTKKEKILSPAMLTASLKAVSPIIGRSSGRRSLSLSRSRCSNVSEFESSTKDKTTDLHLSDSQASSSAISQHRVSGVTPLISVTSDTAADPLPLENGSFEVKKERLRRSVRNNQNIAFKMEADEKLASNDCLSEEICNSNEMTTSILKLKPDAGSSRKSVSFVASNTVASMEKVEKDKKSPKSENIKKTSSSSLPIHIQCGKNEVPDGKLNEDHAPPLANVKSNKTGKQKGYSKANQETSNQKSDSQDSCMSERIAEGEISEPNKTTNRKLSREKKQPASLEIKKESKINDESVDFAKPKPAQRNQRTSKRKAENVPLTEELSSQTSNSSQESSASDIGTRRSTRAKKQRISESSDDGSIAECQAKRPNKSRKAKNASNSSLASSSESLTSISDVEPQTATRKSSRSRKLPTKLIEDTTVTTQEQSSSRTTSRKGTQNNTEGESIEKKESSVNSITDRGRGRRSSNKKLAVPEEEETKVKGVKRLPAPLCEKDNVAGPSKISRRSTTLKPVLETTVENSVLDNSLLSSSLKRGQDESFASDVEHEVKFPKGRRNSVASSSTSPRRSPRPRQQSLKGTATNTARVLFSFLNNPRHESLVKQLGGVIVDSVESADVLVTDKLRRTVKLLCFLGRGLPIVGPPWLLHSKAAGRLLDPWEHILTDQESEMKFNANLSESLKKSGQNPILQGYHIYVTKNVKPIPEEIKAIVTSCGGVILPRAPSAWPANSIAISCVEDKTTWTKYTKKIPIVSPEWLLEGVLRQQLNLEDHRLN